MSSDVAFDLDELYKLWLLTQSTLGVYNAGPRFKEYNYLNKDQVIFAMRIQLNAMRFA